MSEQEITKGYWLIFCEEVEEYALARVDIKLNVWFFGHAPSLPLDKVGVKFIRKLDLETLANGNS